jgi:hypothetical protein
MVGVAKVLTWVFGTPLVFWAVVVAVCSLVISGSVKADSTALVETKHDDAHRGGL